MRAGLDQLVWLVQFTGVSFSLVLCEVLGELPLSPAKFRWQGRQKSLATTRTENAASDFNFVNPIVLYPVFKLPYSYLLVEPLNPVCQDPDIAIRGFFFHCNREHDFLMFLTIMPAPRKPTNSAWLTVSGRAWVNGLLCYASVTVVFTG